MFWRTFITNDSYFLSSLSLTRWIWVPRGLHLDQNLSNRLYWMVTLLVCVVGSGSTKIIKILCNVKMSFLHMFSTVLPFSKVYICHLLSSVKMVIDCFVSFLYHIIPEYPLTLMFFHELGALIAKCSCHQPLGNNLSWYVIPNSLTHCQIFLMWRS